MPTTTVYSSTTDGQILSSNATYSNAREGTGTISANTTGANQNVGQRLFAGTYTCWELFFNFDLIGAGIPASTVATSASLTFDINNDLSTTDFTLEARTKDWGASLTTADWVAGSAQSGQQLLASISTSGIANPFTMTNYVSGTDRLLDAVNNALAGDGILRIMLCSDRHGSGTTPSGNEYLILYTADQTGTTNDPRISVTYTTPGEPFIAVIG